MLIDFKVIPHKKQRYDTVGDYFRGKMVVGRVHIPFWDFRVSRMKDRRYPVLVFLHEMIEFMLCRLAGIKMRDIDRWDIIYERNRPTEDDPEWACAPPCGCQKFYEEPGDDPHAPYHEQHRCATLCERLIAASLGVKWDEYNHAVESLSERTRNRPLHGTEQQGTDEAADEESSGSDHG